MGAHHPRHAAIESRRTTYAALAVVVPLAAITLAAMAWLWPSGTPDSDQPRAMQQVGGLVTEVQPEPCPEQEGEEGAPSEAGSCGTAVVRVTEGAGAGQVVATPLPRGPGAPEVSEDDEVQLIRSSAPDGDTWSIVDHQRDTGLWVLAAAFAFAVVAFGRWRGATALVGLAVTFTLLLSFVVPAILAGEPPLLVAIVGSSAIVLSVLYLTHGFSAWTTVAVVGTLASLALTGLLSALAVGSLELTGFTDDLSTSVGTAYGVDMRGLLLAGIVIGSVGVLDDVTVTQAATVGEIARADPAYGVRDLYRAGTRVGRAHVASVINTIVLAYAGSSLPLVILVVANNDSFGQVVTDQIIAQEVVRSAVATLGLVAAVPITTGLAAMVARRATVAQEPEART
jgi:uncharacterized membrane protein